MPFPVWCIEPPIRPEEFTPEKGRAQLDRMQACFDRHNRFRIVSLAIMIGVFLAALTFIAILVALRGA